MKNLHGLQKLQFDGELPGRLFILISIAYFLKPHFSSWIKSMATIGYEARNHRTQSDEFGLFQKVKHPKLQLYI